MTYKSDRAYPLDFGVVLFVRAVIIALVLLIVIGIVAMMPNRQPTNARRSCANGATPVTWLAVDGDGQTTTNMRCTP